MQLRSFDIAAPEVQPEASARIAQLSALAIALAFFAAVAYWWEHRLFAILALLPAAIGCIDQINAKGRFRIQRGVLDAYTSWQKRRSDKESGFDVVSPRIHGDLEAQRPSFFIRVGAVLFVTAILELAAFLSNPGVGLGRILPKNPSAIDTGLVGLVWAAYGAEVSILWSLIGRLNGNAVSSRFFLNATMRTAIAMILGFAAAAIRLFGDNYSAAMAFLIGAYTPWAYGLIRKKALKLFERDEEGVERLPLGLLDGVGDEVIDLLDEVGISDIEHLATAEPAELVTKTLYPIHRVIDWIDQAILISYLRRQIAVSRRYGVRGALDLVVLYDATTNSSGHAKENATDTLQKLAAKLEMPYSALYMIGRSMWHDRLVSLLYDFWQEE
jgi:hypothetical protein